MDTATKRGIDATKTAFKIVAQETAEATGDLIGNKIAHYENLQNHFITKIKK